MSAVECEDVFKAKIKNTGRTKQSSDSPLKKFSGKFIIISVSLKETTIIL